MKKARTLITRSAVVAVVLVGLSAQAASASSGSSKGDRGKSCWAHSRHKAHKHATGHDHRCDHDHDDHDDDDRDNDDRDDAAPTATIPTTTTIPRPASSESASPVTGSSPSTSVAISPRIGGEIVVIEEPAATEPARENTVVTPGTGGGTSSPTTTPEETPGNVDSPSAGSDTTPEGDQAFMPEDDQPAATPSSGDAGDQEGSLMLTDAQMNESLKIATSQVRQQATMQLWWVLLVLLAVAAETARRVRRNGALNAQGAE